MSQTQGEFEMKCEGLVPHLVDYCDEASQSCREQIDDTIQRHRFDILSIALFRLLVQNARTTLVR
jgi:hypothetical protein